MIIAESDFQLKQLDPVSTKFDLYLPCVIENTKGVKERKFKPVAYGLTIEHAIKKIIHFRMALKHKQEAITMCDYLKEYKLYIQKLNQIINPYGKN